MMKFLTNFLIDFCVYAVCVIVMMGGVQYALDKKLVIDLWSVLLISAPLTFIIRDIRSQPLMFLTIGEKSNDDDHSKSN